MNKSPLFNELSVVIPVYNEEKRIKRSLKKIVSYLDNVCEKYEIIIVDDGSRDKTLAVINEVSNDHFRVIVSEKNRGKGYVVKRGMLAARYKYILFSDADLSTPIEEIENFKEYINDFDVIIGCIF